MTRPVFRTSAALADEDFGARWGDPLHLPVPARQVGAMSDFAGTDGNDTIVGTDGDDTFNISKGQDTLSGLGGIDTLIADISVAATSGAPSSLSVDQFGLRGTIRAGDLFAPPFWSTEFYGMEHVQIVTGATNDGFSLTFDRTIADFTIEIDGGSGLDYADLDLSAGQHAALVGDAAVSIGNASLTLRNIETFHLTLGSGNDDLTLAGGDDTVKAGQGNDRIVGMGGNDRIEGQWGGDHLDGGAGNDNIYAYDGYVGVDDGSEIDTLIGGAGDDLLSIGYGDNADGGTGIDRLSISLRGGPAGAVLDLTALFAGGTIIVGGGTIAGFETYDVIYGTAESDTITTGEATNVGIVGLTGGVHGFGGDDMIITGGRADTVVGGLGNDTIHGGGDKDRLSGDEGNDILYADAGDDTVFGGDGNDEIHGGADNDTINADAGIDHLAGDGGNDILRGGTSGDTLQGGDGNDTLDGEDGDDALYGGDQFGTNFATDNDILNGGAGADAMTGGGGNDVYMVDNAGDGVTELAKNQGTDEIRTTLAIYSLGANVENLTGLGAVNQTLTGNAGANVIDGGAGADAMTGGDGNDVYVIDNAGDGVTELANQGTDEIRTTLASYSLGANVENLTGLGAVNQTLTGNAGANVIDGGAGADAMTGGDGDDIYIVDNAADSVTELAGEGLDEVRTTLSNYTAPENVEKVTLTGGGVHALHGNGGDNVFVGNSGADTFFLEQGGNDDVSGGGGNDGFFFGAVFTAADHVDGGAGTNDQIGLQGDYTGANALTLGANTIANIEAIVLLAGFSYDITTVDGNVAAGGLLKVQATQLAAGQSLTFNGSAETNGSFLVYGGQGNDTMTGGAGDDGFYFGPGGFNGSDVINGGAGTNDQLGLDGDYTITLGGNLTGIEVIVLLHGPSGTPNHFDVTAANSLVGAGQTMTIFGLQVETAIRFDGAGELDGAFRIYGGTAGDNLTGGSGNDWIFGGNGADTLAGGAGNDIFYYDAAAQSTAAAGDTILIFASGDRIDVSGIDAIAGGGDDAFTFLGSGAFTNHAGELRVQDQSGSWLVQADLDGDGSADLQLTLIPGDPHPITSADFTL